MKQSRAFELMMAEENVYLTGYPGSGKTYLINKFINENKKSGKRIAITASTGVAATHINGQTIHSYCGFNVSKIPNLKLIENVKNTDILIIDEISMLSAEDFSKIDISIQKACHISKPFAGKQVILVGDFFQLPPVDKTGKTHFIYTSKSFRDLNLKICYLDEQHRQNDLDPLNNILMSIRNRNVNFDIRNKLNQKIEEYYLNDYIKLYSHNFDVTRENLARNEQLGSKWYKYELSYTGEHRLRETYRSNVPSPDNVIIKVGSKVMFTVNKPEDGFVNGTMGEVKGFKNYKPVVRTIDSKYIFTEWHNWSFQNNELSIKQIPLKLAWAISIHKSQGMSLDRAEIDLSQSFCPGMGYVALSRLKSYKGLVLKGINSMSLVISNEAFESDKELRKLSQNNL